MNRKGFTLIELIATLLILGIILGITIVSVSGIFNSTKNKTEDVFVSTIKDAMDMYISGGNPKDSSGNILSYTRCTNSLTKTHGVVSVYKATTTFQSVIGSKYKPITQDDLVNPANEDVSCNNAANIIINIYRDDDYVYYYSVDKSSFGCLINTGTISNLPKGFVC